MVSLTLMLVIVTIVSAIQLQLPATPYLKVDTRYNIFLALRIEHNDSEYNPITKGGGTLCPPLRFFAYNPIRRGLGVAQIADFSCI